MKDQAGMENGSNEKPIDVLDLMSIPFPRDYNEHKIFSAPIAKRISEVFKGRISSSDLALLQTDPNNPKCAQLDSVLDDVIIEEAATLGPRIFWSIGALSRIQAWHDYGKDGPELLERLFDAIVTSSRVRRGLEQHPITATELYASRKQACAEMKVLCKRLNALTVGLAKLPKGTALYALVSDEITATGRYPLLRMNMKSLFNYLRQEDLDQGGNFARQLLVKGSGATPADIVNGWIDWGFCTSEGQSRKIISKIGSRKQR